MGLHDVCLIHSKFQSTGDRAERNAKTQSNFCVWQQFQGILLFAKGGGVGGDEQFGKRTMTTGWHLNYACAACVYYKVAVSAATCAYGQRAEIMATRASHVV